MFRLFRPHIIRYIARKFGQRFEKQFNQEFRRNYTNSTNSDDKNKRDQPFVSKHKSSKKATKKVGEYIDFEEID